MHRWEGVWGGAGRAGGGGAVMGGKLAVKMVRAMGGAEEQGRGATGCHRSPMISVQAAEGRTPAQICSYGGR